MCGTLSKHARAGSCVWMWLGVVWLCVGVVGWLCVGVVVFVHVCLCVGACVCGMCRCVNAWVGVHSCVTVCV